MEVSGQGSVAPEARSRLSSSAGRSQDMHPVEEVASALGDTDRCRNINAE